MHCEYFFVDDGSDRKAVEAIGERFPQLDVVPTFTRIEVEEKGGQNGTLRSMIRTRLRAGLRTFVVEAIDSINARTFVVAS